MLHKLDNLIEGTVVKRPSRHIRTPYVADVLINDEEVLAHSPALGCCGLADVSANVLLAVSPEPKTKTKPKNQANLKCSHTIYLALVKESKIINNSVTECEQIVGIHPKLAETLVESALTNNLLTKLQNIIRFRRETVIKIQDKIDSRFDFTGVDCNNIPFIMEVKNVPLADYEDITAKERVKLTFDDREVDSKVAYFPDGYRKSTADTVSPRALKHMEELTYIKKETNIRCIMCYVIQRTDVNRFQPSVIDPQYRSAFKNAIDAGVEIITMVVSWNRNGEATFIRDDLPLSMDGL